MTMRFVLFCSFLAIVTACGRTAEQPPETTTTTSGASDSRSSEIHQPGIVDHVVESLDGEIVDLASFRGKALLIVNTASECGYTPHYAGLQELSQRYADRGLLVLGFPSNDFGGQEPGSHEQIRAFCTKNFGVTFPMFAKIHTKGPEIAPLYRTLTQEGPAATRGDVKWNFTKFLVDQDGMIVARFEPRTEPLSPDIVSAIELLLASPEAHGASQS
jgi:glutathione peroxidase